MMLEYRKYHKEIRGNKEAVKELTLKVEKRARFMVFSEKTEAVRQL